MNPILMTEEYWLNSQFSLVRFYGGCKINGEDYSIVDKDGMIAPEMLLALLGDDAQTSRRLSPPKQEEGTPKRRMNEMTVFTEQ